MLKTLVNRARKICEPRFLDAELGHLERALQNNGYSAGPIRSDAPDLSVSQEFVGPAVLPYIEGVTMRIGRLLSRHGARAIYKPTRKIQQFCRQVKDARDPLSSCGVYCVPCSCGQIYVYWHHES